MIKVNVLLATYNGINFLDAQIASLAKQKNVSVSLFVNDDGSTDGTKTFLEKLKPYGAIHTVHLSHSNRLGASYSFLQLLSTCLSHSNTSQHDLFAFCDQDDEWSNEKLIKANDAIKIFGSQKPILYGGRTELVDERLKHIGYSPLFKKKPHFKNALVQNIMGGNTMVFNYKAAALISTLNQPQGVRVPMHDLWAYQIVSGANGIVIYDENPQIKYRQHNNNLLGAGIGWSSRFSRFLRLLNGVFKRNNHLNLAALAAKNHELTADNREVIAKIMLASNSSSVITRLIELKESGAFRQSLLQNISLWFACLIKRL